MFLFLLAVTALLSCIIVLPLWYSAIHAKEVYTTCVFVLAVAGILGFIGVRVRKEVRESGDSFKVRLLKSLKKLLLFFSFLLLLIGVLFLFGMKLYYLAVPALLFYLILLGFVRYGRKRISAP